MTTITTVTVTVIITMTACFNTAITAIIILNFYHLCYYIIKASSILTISQTIILGRTLEVWSKLKLQTWKLAKFVSQQVDNVQNVKIPNKGGRVFAVTFGMKFIFITPHITSPLLE